MNMRTTQFVAGLARKTFASLLVFGPMLPAGAGGANELRTWDDYHVIMWVGDSAYKRPGKVPLFFERLRQMGVDTAMVYGDGPLDPLLENHFPYYVENVINRGLCLKFNSEVRDWDKFVTQWAAAGRPETGLKRDYCLDDPAWQTWAANEMRHVALKNRPHEPLAYDIRDELSTTLSANPFDYDFNPLSLVKFREWLRTQYASLSALNSEWETRFDTWEQVRPFTTDQVKNRMAGGGASPRGAPDWAELERLKFVPTTARRERTRWNFSPWADFRTYMDLSLARALDNLRSAARQADPRTPVGIEGTQMPHAFGGYDLWRLAQVLDWVEPYDIGNAREVLGSFMRGKPIVTTVFEQDTAHARRRLWHLLLQGDRGCIVWWSEDCIDWGSPEYRLTAKGRALAPVLQELASPLARLFLRAKREADPVLIHYSQASIQTDWLLESTVDGSSWLRRFSSFEAEHNRQARVRNGWLKLFQDLGYTPEFISSDQIERGELARRPGAVLVLPSSWAASDREAEAFQNFLASNDARCAIVWDGTPGEFDQHGRLRENPLPLFAQPRSPTEERGCTVLAPGRPPVFVHDDITRYGSARLKREPSADLAKWLASALPIAPPEVRVSGYERVRVHRFRVPRGRLLAFENNVDYQMSEDLKQAGGNEALEQPREIEVTLQEAAHVYDLCQRKYLGHVTRLRFTLDPWRPSLLAVTAEKLEGEPLNQLAP